MSKEQALAIAQQLATTKLNPDAAGGLEAQKEEALGNLKAAFDVVSDDVPKRDRQGIWRTAKTIFDSKNG